MEEKTKILVSLSAAVGANCIPCFEHLYYRSLAVKLDPEEVQETIEIASRVKSGAHVALKSAISDIMSGEHAPENSETCPCGG